MINPLYEHVLIDVEEEDQMTKGGIFIPETSLKSPWLKGKVLKVGCGHRSLTGEIHPLQVKPNDTILFRKGAGIELKDEDGTKYLVLQEKEIIGIV